MAPSLLLVAGAGRSGTSLLTGVAHRLGFHLPQPQVRPNRTNPRGFGEPQWIVDFDRRLLRRAGVKLSDARPTAWEAAGRIADEPSTRAELRGWLANEFAGADRVVVKDPHLTWLFDLYRGVAEELSVDLSVATMVRHPIENTKSRKLAYGDTNSDTTRLAGWLNVMLHIEYNTRGLSRALIAYDDLLEDWRSALQHADRSLGAGLLSKATAEQQQAVADLIDPRLRRAVGSWEELSVPSSLQQLAEEAFKALTELTAGPQDHDHTLRDLDDVRARYVQLYEDSEAIADSTVAAARVEERRRRAQRRRTPAPAPRRTASRSDAVRRARSALGRLRSSATTALWTAPGMSLESQPPRYPVYFLTYDLGGLGGVTRSVCVMANGLVDRHDVEIISLYRQGAFPRAWLDPRVQVTFLEDLRTRDAVTGRRQRLRARDDPARSADERELDARPSVVSPRFDAYSALTDQRIGEKLAALQPGAIIADRPPLQAAVATFAGPEMVLVAAQHSSSAHRGRGVRRLLAAHGSAFDAVITFNPEDESAYTELLGPEAQVVMIPNPIDMPQTAATLRESRLIVTAGALHTNKGFDRLIRAFAPLVAEHPDWRLRIYGKGSERRPLESLVAELGVQDNVGIMGFHRNLGEVFQEAACYTVTSHHESFGLALVEAMGAGLPPVSFDGARGPRHLIEHGVNGLLVPEGDIDAYTQALRLLMEDPRLRERLGARARESMRRFDVHHVAQEWEALIDQAWARRSRSTRNPLRRR